MKRNTVQIQHQAIQDLLETFRAQFNRIGKSNHQIAAILDTLIAKHPDFIRVLTRFHNTLKLYYEFARHPNQYPPVNFGDIPNTLTIGPSFNDTYTAIENAHEQFEKNILQPTRQYASWEDDPARFFDRYTRNKLSFYMALILFIPMLIAMQFFILNPVMMLAAKRLMPPTLTEKQVINSTFKNLVKEKHRLENSIANIKKNWLLNPFFTRFISVTSLLSLPLGLLYNFTINRVEPEAFVFIVSWFIFGLQSALKTHQYRLESENSSQFLKLQAQSWAEALKPIKGVTVSSKMGAKLDTSLINLSLTNLDGYITPFLELLQKLSIKPVQIDDTNILMKANTRLTREAWEALSAAIEDTQQSQTVLQETTRTFSALPGHWLQQVDTQTLPWVFTYTCHFANPLRLSEHQQTEIDTITEPQRNLTLSISAGSIIFKTQSKVTPEQKRALQQLYIICLSTQSPEMQLDAPGHTAKKTKCRSSKTTDSNKDEAPASPQNDSVIIEWNGGFKYDSQNPRKTNVAPVTGNLPPHRFFVLPRVTSNMVSPSTLSSAEKGMIAENINQRIRHGVPIATAYGAQGLRFFAGSHNGHTTKADLKLLGGASGGTRTYLTKLKGTKNAVLLMPVACVARPH